MTVTLVTQNLSELVVVLQEGKQAAKPIKL